MESNYRFVVATAFAAASLVSVSDAGLVGTTCGFQFSGPSGQVFGQSSFIVSSLLPEFYYSTPVGDRWAGFSVDIQNTSLTLTMDYDPLLTSVYFLPDTWLALSIPETLQFDEISLGQTTNVTNLEIGDVFGAGTRSLLIRSSDISFSAPGASFTINFTTSAVPGPSALVILSAFAAIASRRRRG
jgi:hypothetical protein